MDEESQIRRLEYDAKLNEFFGYSALKDEQFFIIDQILNYKKDICAVLATGFGKSVCYQMPYLLTGKCVFVVSPLISLMADQQADMERLGISVSCLNSTNKNKTQEKKELMSGEYKLIYITPEYLLQCESLIQNLYDNDAIAMFAIDESHCVSTWGFDFRISYTHLSVLREWAPSVPILALTATATEKVREDICSVLCLMDPLIVVGNFDRPNLYISAIPKMKDIDSDLEDLLNKYKDEYMIIYCKTRDDTDKLTVKVKNMGIECGSYHAGLTPQVRADIQAQFIEGTVKCIVATVAFGMGINIPNVRLVVHYGCPKNLESYYQEIGRAGRDGKPSECYMYHSPKDFQTNRWFLKSIKIKKHKDYQEEQINAIQQYVYTSECRRKLLLKNFGGKVESCTNCDNCVKNIKHDARDYTLEAYLLLGTMIETKNMYGMTMYINILRGSDSKTMNYYMKKIKFYGAGKARSIDWWKHFSRLLLNAELLKEKRMDKSKFGGSTTESTKKGTEWFVKIKNKYPEICEDRSKITNEDKLMLVPSQELVGCDKKIKPTTANIVETINPETGEVIVTENNAGKKWTTVEENKMLELLKTKTISQVATELKRTNGSITARLWQVATLMYEKGKTLDSISNITRITTAKLQEYFTKKGIKTKIDTSEPELEPEYEIMEDLMYSYEKDLLENGEVNSEPEPEIPKPVLQKVTKPLTAVKNTVSPPKIIKPITVVKNTTAVSPQVKDTQKPYITNKKSVIVTESDPVAETPPKPVKALKKVIIKAKPKNK